MKSIDDIIDRELKKLRDNFNLKLAEKVRHLIIVNYERHDIFRKYYLETVDYIQEREMNKYKNFNL